MALGQRCPSKEAFLFCEKACLAAPGSCVANQYNLFEEICKHAYCFYVGPSRSVRGNTHCNNFSAPLTLGSLLITDRDCPQL